MRCIKRFSFSIQNQKRARFIGQLMLGLIVSWSSFSAFSLQSRTVSDNGETSAFVSTTGLTRISMANDRITDVRGPNGRYALQNDNREGAVFVKVVGEDKTPFTLFIATEKNHNVVLHVTPKAKTPDSIVLNSETGQTREATRWEDQTPYTDVLTQLLKAMTSQSPLEDYATFAIQNGKRQWVGGMATLKLVSLYNGAHIQGQIYRLTNRTNHVIRFNERLFFHQGDRAIALQETVLPPHGVTFLYKVVSL